MFSIKYISALLLFSITIQTNASNAKQIWTFGTKNHNFYNAYNLNQYTVKNYQVDSGKNFEKSISIALSNNPNIAYKQAKELFFKNKNLWDKQAKQDWQGAVNAQSLGITKLPAISFDQGETVIYGVLNISKAFNIWKSYKEKEQ